MESVKDWPGANLVLQGDEEKGVNDLHVYRDETRTIALFELDAAEVLDIIQTHRFAVSILGHLWPPVRLDTVKVRPDDIDERKAAFEKDPNKPLVANAHLVTALEAIRDGDVDLEEAREYAGEILEEAAKYWGPL